MSKLFWSLRITLILLLLAGCAKKEIYQFSQPIGSFKDAEKNKQKELPAPNLNKSAVLAPMPEEKIMFSASDPVIELTPAPVKSESEAIYPPYKADKMPELTSRFVAKTGGIFFKTLLKKGLQKAERVQDKRPVHKLAKVGLAFSLGGVFMHVFGFLITGTGGGFMLLAILGAIVGVILSGLGYQRIRKNPEQYAGKGWAIAGALIGLLLLLLYLYVILGFMPLDNIAG